MSGKRISLTILLAVAIITCFVGCGKKEPGTIISEKEIDISELISENETDENEQALDEVQEEEPEEQVVSFECMDEIKEASPESGLVQIDDMIFQYGCKMSEAIEIIENSQSSFQYQDGYVYNENELVLSDGYVNIVFLKGTDFYFQFQVRNLTGETAHLKDCNVVRIITEKSSKGNVFYAGFNDEGDNAVTYDYVKNVAMKDYEMEREITESDPANLQKKYINILYIMPNSASETGEMWLYFVFESDTGELSRLKLNSNYIQ